MANSKGYALIDAATDKVIADKAGVDHSFYIGTKEDWISSSVSGGLGWQSVTIGGGSAVSKDNTYVDNKHSGIINITAGPLTGRLAQIYLSLDDIVIGGGKITREVLFYIPTLGVSASDYTILQMGFLNNSVASDPGDGVWIEYNLASSVNWIKCTANNSSYTKTPSSTAVVAGAWTRIRITIPEGAAEVQYDIQNPSGSTWTSLGDPITTTIPTSSLRKVGIGFKTWTGDGTVARSTHIDFTQGEMIFSTSR